MTAEPLTAVQMARLGVFLEWDRADTARYIARHHDMTLEDALALWDREYRELQERGIRDSHDELLDAEAKRQEHGAI